MPKKNTIFNYFSKSPKQKVVKTSKSPGIGDEKILKKPKKSNANTPKADGNVKACKYELYDILWAKLDGFPWWPSMVCNHPTKDVHFERNRSTLVHVQFFDDPPSRAWIKEKNLKVFVGPDNSNNPKYTDPVWRKSVEDAVKALEISKEDRNHLIICLDSSSDEHDDDELKISESGDISSDINGDVKDDRSIDNQDMSPKEPAKKRRRIIIASDSEVEDSADEEFKPGKEDSDSDSVSSGVDENEVSDIESESEELSPAKKENGKRKRKEKLNSSFEPSTPTNTKRSPTVKDDTKLKLAMFASPESSKTKPREDYADKVWAHLKLDWLQDDQRRDLNHRPVSHPSYNPRTLFVPESFKKSLTPALKQWWEMKSYHFDTVLFFKVGKFYEFYHMDAVIGVNELGLLYMKGEFAHSGFPEISYGRYSAMLINRGYKVARVEQTETPQMMEERCKQISKPTKYDRVVTREICRITTKGTRTFGFQEGDPEYACNTYLLALTEKRLEKITGDKSEYGICFIDTSIGKFHIGQFTDDRNCSRLRTLIAHYPPVQILSEKGSVSPKTQQVLNSCVGSVLKEYLKPIAEFWNSAKTLKFLSEGNYFVDENRKEDGVQWPETLKKVLDENDSLCQTAHVGYDLAVKALGACIWYLQECYIDEEILTMKMFEIYEPVDDGVIENKVLPTVTRQHMILDGVTLRNLDILSNSATGTIEGTLLETLDSCSTLFGKRLLHQWICSPLCNPAVISERLNAIEDIQNSQEIIPEITKHMRKLPDLERLLSRIHTQGLCRKSDHPDTRAILYEAEIYSKRKINDFLSLLEGFKVAVEIMRQFETICDSFKSSLLKQCVSYQSEGGLFPHLKNDLLFFDNSFDHEKAKKDGKIIPSPGVDKEYDAAMVDIKQAKKDFDVYLQELKDVFNCKINYFGSGRNRYQLEIPEHAVKYATNEYELQSQRKGFKRYWTPTIKELLAKLTSAEEHRDVALKDIMRRIFATFDNRRKKWEAAIHCLCVLDVLLSLTQYSLSSQVPMCRPEFIISDTPSLEIKEGRHPILMKYMSGDSFIPNDVCIGTSKETEDDMKRLVLVTGPNMGGKSTLMRQIGLISIMAQMGSYVPAEVCRLTPIDRIFTRLGASDRITSGESTFFVELSETASILHHATKHSLVLLDELGRGTSTYDGTGIACAVVNELASSVCCRTLFSTHYHSLVDEFISHSCVKLGHMSCMVENENEDPTQETITFLYKFVDGACPKSYGFNAAQLAGIPEEITRQGYYKAKELEKCIQSRRLFRLLYNCKNTQYLKELQKEIIKYN